MASGYKWKCINLKQIKKRKSFYKNKIIIVK